MKIAVGIKTYNLYFQLREELFWQCYESAQIAFPGSDVVVFDNGSTDGTSDLVEELGGRVIREGNKTPGSGFNGVVKSLLELHPDVIVHSDDDILWKPESQEVLSKFWSGNVVKLVSGLLEPVWHWNTPRYVVESNGVKALVRDSAPGAAWSFHVSNLDWIYPVTEKFGYDYDTCVKILNSGMTVAQMDLTEHIGWEHSTHGNRAIHDPNTQPLDREKYGI